MEQILENKSILLIISGGIAAYKGLELLRQLKRAGATVRCILTKGGAQFITPLSVASLSEEEVYTDLFSLKDETEMGHIRLSREADLIIIAPASANLLARMAQGEAEDLASTTLLAANKPIMIAPAMNQEMWAHPATQTNLKTLSERGILQVGPASGDMACGETGLGRMSEPGEIFEAVTDFFFEKPLKGKKAVVTTGPTYEPLDPVRFIGNRSSGIQGQEIARALLLAGADVTLISGPTNLPALEGTKLIRVETANEMLKATQEALPADIGVFAAAVSDWAPEEVHTHKIKKRDDTSPPSIQMKENPDILKTIASGKSRPTLTVGFAAETENLTDNARAKLVKKQCDWILANNVSPEENVFGSSQNHVYLVTNSEIDDWGKTSKKQIAGKLAKRITEYFENHERSHKHAAE